MKEQILGVGGLSFDVPGQFFDFFCHLFALLRSIRPLALLMVRSPWVGLVCGGCAFASQSIVIRCTN